MKFGLLNCDLWLWEWQSSVFQSEHVLCLFSRLTQMYLPTSHVCWDLTDTVGNTEFNKLVSSLAVCPPSLWRTSMDPVLFTLHLLVKKHTLTTSCYGLHIERVESCSQERQIHFSSHQIHSAVFQGSQVSWWVRRLCPCVWPDLLNLCCTLRLSARATSNPYQALATAAGRPPRNRLARVSTQKSL